jgi:hypothetical protein
MNYPAIFLEELRKPTRNSVIIIGVRADIRTERTLFYFFLIIILSGVRLSPLGTAATTGLSAPLIRV